MNKLEQKILDSIQSDEVWMDNGEDLMQFTLTANITTIIIDFAKGFAEWVDKKGYWKSVQYGIWYPAIAGSPLTTDQLIEEYIKTL